MLKSATQVKEDPFNLVHSAVLKKGKALRYQQSELSWHAFTRQAFEKKKARERTRQRRVIKMHPLLKRWLAKSPRSGQVSVIVRFTDPLQLPRFPMLDEGSRKSKENARVLRESQRLIQEIQSRRSDSYGRLTREFSRRHKAKVLETFWLIHAMLVKLPLASIPAILEREDVLYVQPQDSGEAPPQDEVDDGRARIVSDPYFNLGQTGGFIGLLDTGVRFTHNLFNTPGHVDFRRDCVNGDGLCQRVSPTATFDPTDSDWNHGTSTAAIITANNRLGNDYRGVTGITLDSFKVYTARGLNSASAVRGFQAAVAALDRVIVAEMQGGGNDLDAISAAADAAFDAGAVIIAANGNGGPTASTVNVPAIAHRVLGVGSFDVQTQKQAISQSRGPAPDGRIKPDIQVPTNTETASNASDTALRIFAGTSGATPYAAGAAALLRNWLRGTSGSIDPGQVYAHMILAGQQPFPFNNTSGAGPIRLPVNGRAWWGKVSVTNGQDIFVPLGIDATTNATLDAALWWPEWVFNFPILGRIEAHSDVDLYLVDPRGASRASSVAVDSVFERARVSGSIARGTWMLHIRGYDVPGTQTVYWAAALHS
jgi:hypothetical protein